jgi:uncharacterized membrane protein YcaP (DUF421 family)
MEPLLRAAAVYFALLVLIRLTGKRSLAQLTAFDFVLLLIVSEATQQALLGDDYSVTTAVIVITTLLAIERLFDALAHRSARVDRWVNGTPLVIVEDGRLLRDRMDHLHITEDEIMEQARHSHGLERLDQIKHAVVERTGAISVIPRTGG